ncbi:hypothetical protein FS749_006336 [Ceratobasidium sp. UAMH 11750]|nr:hypothetical protein FS749_006336 [Ceratobasidium sp. UAMH 11750]
MVTAIAFTESAGYVALSTAREVVILQRSNALSRHEPTEDDDSDDSDGYQVVDRLEPFEDVNTSINCLAFYGHIRFNLIVGGSTGLAIYAVYFTQQPCRITTNYEYKIARCAVSEHEDYLAVSTLDQQLVYWDLQITGPVISNPRVVDLSADAPANHTRSSVLSVAITAADMIVGGTSDGRVHFVDITTARRYASRGFSNQHKVQAMTICGPRLYIMNVANSNPTRVSISAYTQDSFECDFKKFMAEQPNGFKPRVGLLNQRPQGSNAGPSGTTCRRMPGCSFCLFLVIMALLTPLVTFLYVCVAGIKVVTEDPHAPYGSRLASVGVHLIYVYLPFSWRAPAESVLIALLCIYRLLVRLFLWEL